MKQRGAFSFILQLVDEVVHVVDKVGKDDARLLQLRVPAFDTLQGDKTLLSVVAQDF